jgi:hypothetical protein
MGERISYLHGRKRRVAPDKVRAGDIVKTGRNDYPRFKVIAVDSGRAWLRNVISGDDAVVSLEDCCWRVNGGEQPDEPIGRLLSEEPVDRTGPKAPVEPPRIDRIFPPNEPASPEVGPQGG